MKVYYFGCWSSENHGHFFYEPSGNHVVKRAGDQLPAGWFNAAGRFRDGEFAGATSKATVSEQAEQGRARLYYEGGWTLMAFWDRSSDQRYGSNSAFLVEGSHDFGEVCAIAEDHFPSIWERITSAFEVAPA